MVDHALTPNEPATPKDPPWFDVLDDPLRRRIYLYVRAQHRVLTRDEVAEGMEISRSLAAFHLDKLLEAGLLRSHYAHSPGRAGPGSGRPPKRYEASDTEVRILIPERHYELMGELLARALDRAPFPRLTTSRACELARTKGREIGRAVAEERADTPSPDGMDATCEVVAGLGYEPAPSRPNRVALHNCPFHAVVPAAKELICGLNQALLAGIIDGLGARDVSAVLDPGEDRCCVALVCRAT